MNEKVVVVTFEDKPTSMNLYDGINLLSPKAIRSTVLGTTTQLIKIHASCESSRTIIICFDIPFIFYSKILEKQCIPIDNLTFIDAVTRISGNANPDHPNVRLMDGPFFLPDVLAELSLILTDDDPRETYLVIDNVTNLVVFNSLDTVQKFLSNLIVILNASSVKRSMFIIEKEKNPMLHDYLVPLVDIRNRMAGCNK